jgi:glucose/arabinose dehydrogenase
MGIRNGWALVAAFTTVFARSSSAALPTDFAEEVMASGLSLPTGIAQTPDGRVLVVEQGSASIKQVSGGAGVTLTTISDVSGGGERGLLGIAVDPAWPSRPFVYVYLSYTPTSTIHVARFTVGGDLSNTGSGALTIDPASRYEVLSDLPDYQGNHNGGTLRFGPDGMLYLSLGDDAGGCVAQDLTSLRGQILRLDVRSLPAGPGGPPARSALVPADNPYAGSSNDAQRLVWAFGFRNPFRFSIDPSNGQLFVADVGESSWEEMDQVTAGGLDFGWPWKEANSSFGSCSDNPPGLVAPIYSYAHTTGSYAIMAGPLYRRTGSRPFPQDYDGDVFLCDYYKGELIRLDHLGGTWAVAAMAPGQPSSTAWGNGFAHVTDFLVGTDGAIWCCRQGDGQITRITYNGALDVPIARAPARKPTGVFDVQGRRVASDDRSGIYFKPGKKKVAVVK